MSASRKLRRRKLRRVSGICYQAECKAKAKATHECKVCEAQKAKGIVDEVFTVGFCPRHAEGAEKLIKGHVLGKHKGTAFLTALRVGYTDQ